jgi:hypothetical protein
VCNRLSFSDITSIGDPIINLMPFLASLCSRFARDVSKLFDGEYFLLLTIVACTKRLAIPVDVSPDNGNGHINDSLD